MISKMLKNLFWTQLGDFRYRVAKVSGWTCTNNGSSNVKVMYRIEYCTYYLGTNINSTLWKYMYVDKIHIYRREDTVCTYI
jgi:hypothetical protein